MTEQNRKSRDNNTSAISLEDVMDIGTFQDLSESFSKLSGIAAAILTLEGKILAASGWQKICTDFHRKNPESCKLCHESDTHLANQLTRGNQFNLYQCRHGLIDVAVPINVDGIHIGNVFTGQFLLQPPDIRVFEEQAEKYGYDRREYLNALKEVPVLTAEKIRSTIKFP